MNPREFCSKPGFPVAILLTFNFDPIFFERVILRDLELGETEDILIIADQGQVFSSIDRWKDQVLHLGRKYQVIPTKISNTFHPKMILRCGPDQTGLWVASGNISFGGWGGNQELASSWFSQNQSTNDFLISEILKNLQAVVPESSSIDVISRAQNYLSPTPTSSDNSPILFAHGSNSLSSLLQSRWEGISFRKVTIFTGSTDENGAFLNWLNINFGVEEAVVLVDQNHVSFSAQKINSLPIKTSVKSLLGTKPLHAKFYWFEGDEGNAAIMGSANCSAAAWLVPPLQGGNYEAIAVYDEAEIESFQHILGKLEGELTDTVLTGRTQETKKQSDNSKIGIPEVLWDSSTGLLSVTFSWNKEQITSLETTIGNEVITFEGGPLSWKSTCSVILSENKTKFLEFSLALEDGSQINLVGWVNDLYSLRQSSKVRKITDALSRLGEGQPSSEHDKMMTDLQKISQLLLEGKEHFPDQVITVKNDPNNSNLEENPKQIKPDDFIKSISEIEVRRQNPIIPMAESGGFSISAILRAFFGIKEEVVDILDEEEDEDITNNLPNNEPRKFRTKPDPPNEKNQKRFQKMVTQFLERLADNAFVDSCSLLQLKNAISYPLAACYLGQKDGWLDSISAAEFIRRTFDIVFRRKFGDEKGLLQAVKKRYEQNKSASLFTKEIGDGELWTVFLVSINKTQWNFVNGTFERKLALRSVFNSNDLFESVNAGRLGDLFMRIEEDERLNLINESQQSSQNFEKIENELKERQNELAGLQQNRLFVFEAGDLIWIKGGWAEVVDTVSLGENTVVYHHAKGEKIKINTKFFLNVSKLCAADTSICSLFSRINEE